MPKVIGLEEMSRLMDEGAQVLEVLGKEEFERAHLPGALNIPAWELSLDRVAAALSRDRPVIVYCYDSL